jgi:hypothetical protein
MLGIVTLESLGQLSELLEIAKLSGKPAEIQTTMAQDIARQIEGSNAGGPG